MLIREDFRRDGIATTFLIDKELFEVFSSAFPAGTRFNIGYPSICNEEAIKCKEILENDSQDFEFCLVGHARRYDLEIMANLISKHNHASANIWVPASNISAQRIMKAGVNEVLQKALYCIKYWKSISNKPLDIALTDVTTEENYIIERIHDWMPILHESGYRDIILCDTKGIGNETFLNKLFRDLDPFEWHPHNDNNNSINTINLALNWGANRIGTSLLGCSERMNMIDPRILEGTKINEMIILKFINEFNERFGNIDELKNTIYGKNSIITGTHYLLWGANQRGNFLFGVTTNRELASKMLNRKINSDQLQMLKDELLYKKNCFYLTHFEFVKFANNILDSSKTNII